MFHRKLSNVGILNGLVDKFKIHIPLCCMAVYEFKGLPQAIIERSFLSGKAKYLNMLR
ncbi:MAG: hypothetical protein NC393_04825 [Clostridium sp.]|nr:hypothetical protein [Clostridium sp.]